MSRGWRLFVALPLPAGSARAIESRLSEARGKVPEARWVPPERLHLTLRFLGQQPATVVPGLRQALAGVSERWSPFPVRVTGGRSFGRADEAAGVCWLGLDTDGGAAVISLAAAVEEVLARSPDLDAGPAPMGLQAHLTVARRAPPQLVGLVDAAVAGIEPAIGWEVDRLRLYRSHLEADGARHESLWTGRLGRPAGPAAVPRSTAGHGSQGPAGGGRWYHRA